MARQAAAAGSGGRRERIRGARLQVLRRMGGERVREGGGVQGVPKREPEGCRSNRRGEGDGEA